MTESETSDRAALKEFLYCPPSPPVHIHMHGRARRGTLLTPPAEISRVYEQLYKKGAAVTGCSREKDQIGYDSRQ
jgi:hypothetical protein